jgi:hypothetical protein
VAITPMKFDVTDQELLSKMAQWKWPMRFE